MNDTPTEVRAKRTTASNLSPDEVRAIARGVKRGMSKEIGELKESLVATMHRLEQVSQRVVVIDELTHGHETNASEISKVQRLMSERDTIISKLTDDRADTAEEVVKMKARLAEVEALLAAGPTLTPDEIEKIAAEETASAE